MEYIKSLSYTNYKYIMDWKDDNLPVKEIIVNDDIESKIVEAQATNGLGSNKTVSSKPQQRTRSLKTTAMGATVVDEFWLDDISFLLRSDRLAEFLPCQKLSTNEQLNALTRFFIYLGVVVAFYRKSLKPFIFVSAIPIACIAYYFLQVASCESDHDHEQFDTSTELRPRPRKTTKRMHPTASNPLMNPDPTMYGTEDYLIPPADVNDPIVQKEIRYAFNEGDEMFKNAEDIWERKKEQLMFYTVPRYIDNGEFQDYLYKLPPETCKEDTANCNPPYRSHRGRRPVLFDSTQNPSDS